MECRHELEITVKDVLAQAPDPATRQAAYQLTQDILNAIERTFDVRLKSEN